MDSRILVVDDTPLNLKLVCDILEMKGYNIERATNADEAMAVLKRTRVDLILMDIELPGMDGLTLTRQLKADVWTRHIPVVALTAFAMKGDHERALEAGCDGYISKPIDTRKLPLQVAAMIQHKDGAEGNDGHDNSQR